MVKIVIDQRTVLVEEDGSVLEAIRANGIKIPTLCYHPALKPSGSCRLCVVEVVGKTGRPVTMLSCVMKVRDGLEIKTTGELVQKARVKAFKDLLQQAPQAAVIRKLADEFGVDVGPPPDGCIRCRLCIRVCKEIVGANALKMAKRDGMKFVVPTEGLCIGCGTCVNLCPTGAISLEDKDSVRTISIRGEIIGRHMLEHCEACGRLFATQRFLSHVKTRVMPHPDVREHHQYCPTCAKLFSSRVKTSGKLM